MADNKGIQPGDVKDITKGINLEPKQELITPTLMQELTTRPRDRTPEKGWGVSTQPVNKMADGGMPQSEGLASNPQSQSQQSLVNGDMHQALLKANPAIQKILIVRLKSMPPQEQVALGNLFTPDTTPIILKILPEMAPMIAKANQMAMQQQNQGGQPQDPSQQGNIPSPGSVGPAKAGQGATQVGPVDPNRMFGFAAGGPVLNRNGYVNKGIPTNSLARGGMPTGARVAPAPHAMAPFRPTMPAEERANSRRYNRPIGFADGGMIPNGQPMNGMAQGGQPVDPNMAQGGQPQQGLAADPKMAQQMQNQAIAQSVMPEGSSADNVPAKVSKGEFVMDAPTVAYWGIGKMTQMQSKAHEEIAKHVMKQAAQQQQDQGDGPQGQPQAQQQKPMPQQQGLASPPPQMPSQTQSPPNATDQRIQQTNTPRPMGNPMSLTG